MTDPQLPTAILDLIGTPGDEFRQVCVNQWATYADATRQQFVDCAPVTSESAAAVAGFVGATLRAELMILEAHKTFLRDLEVARDNRIAFLEGEIARIDAESSDSGQ